MADLNDRYEREHRREIRRLQAEIHAEFYAVIDAIIAGTVGLRLVEGTFRLSDYPHLQSLVQSQLLQFRGRVQGLIETAAKQRWGLSRQKMTELMKRRFDVDNFPIAIETLLNAPREEAAQAFLSRKVAGKTLSDRVWKLTYQFQAQIESGLFVGLQDGASAATMARDLKQYLRHPDKLFRRVRDAKGRLVLSKNARRFHPGQGVYRSSYKNALRLSRETVNESYREADHQQWKELPMVLGVEVRLSDRHPQFDMCDHLKGIYPVGFKFTGWHIQCICYAVPVLPTREQYLEYERAILEGREDRFEFTGVIKNPPAGFGKWVNENQERVARWKRKPQFMIENRRFI